MNNKIKVYSQMDGASQPNTVPAYPGLREGLFFFIWAVIIFLMVLTARAATSCKDNEYAPGVVLAKFKSETPASVVDRANAALQAHVAQKFRGDPDLYLLKLPDEVSVAQAIEFYKANSPEIEYVEPNWIYCPTDTTPNDPSFAGQWNMAQINAPRAWDFSTGDARVIVADNDTGADLSHPDLADNLWPGIGWDFLTGSPWPQDTQGHGSHTGGTIAAVSNNGLGVAGVMWSAQLMVLKICETNCSVSAAIQAIDFGVQNGARVSNNSWGGTGRSQALQDAINRADQAGVLFIAAAGNNGNDNDARPFYPCNYGVEGSPNVICVAAATTTDGRASFSNYGANSVHLAAPGSSVLSTYKDGGYARLSGTSMATPHVTGVVGLIWSQNLDLSHMQVKDILLNSVRPAAAWQGLVQTSGLLEAGAALQNTP